MTDLAKAREILDRNPELARKLGYKPQDQRPQVSVSVNTPQARIDELVAAGYRPVIDEQLSRALGELPAGPRIEIDPVSGRREYIDPRPPLLDTPRRFGGTPPMVIEQSRSFGRFPINRYALRPGREFVAQALPGAQLDANAEPTMFASGDLPPLTGSGADPSVLAWCSWEMRHSAAYANSRSQVLEIVEASAEGIVEDELQNEPGRHALASYVARVRSWASTMPSEPDRVPTEEEMASWFPPESR